MRHLVTGSSGFIGRHLVAALTSRGDEVATADWITGRTAEESRDLSRPECWLELMGRAGKVDIIWHLAAYASEWGSRTHRARAMRNAVMLSNAIEAARASGVSRVYYTSSAAVYGHGERQREDCYPNPCDPYGISKLAGEMDLVWSGVPHTILRLHNVYGPGQSPYTDRNAVAILMRAALDGKPMPIVGDGQQVRAFTYIKDVMDACVSLIESPHDGALNFGSNEPHTILELAEEIRLALNMPGAPAVHLPGRDGEPELVCPDHSNAEDLGLCAKTKLKDGLRLMAAWMREGGCK